jgi:hypothetical protein
MLTIGGMQQVIHVIIMHDDEVGIMQRIDLRQSQQIMKKDSDHVQVDDMYQVGESEMH